MKKLWMLAMVAVVACGGVMLCGCGGSDDDDDNDAIVYVGGNTVGSWALISDTTFVITFNADGSYATTLNGVAFDSGTWASNGNYLQTTKATGGTFLFSYSVVGDSLTLTALGGNPEAYTRIL